jgi:hypothetical protein
MSGQDVHRALAIVVGTIGVVVLVATIGWSRLGRPGRLAVDRAILAAIVAVLVAIGSGLLLVIGGPRPSDPLHFVYATAALLVLPVVRFAQRLAGRRALWIAVGAAVLLGLVVRLAQTG